MTAEPKKGAPKYAQLVSEVRKLAQRVEKLEAEKVTWAVSDKRIFPAGVGISLDDDKLASSPTEHVVTNTLVIPLASNARCPGCGAIVGDCADTCAYERKHAVRVQRYGDDAA